MRSSRAVLSVAAILAVVAAACVPTPPDPSGDPWGDGCEDDRAHFKDWAVNEDQPGEWWYTSGTGVEASVGLTDEYGAPEGYGCHAALLTTGEPGTAPEDNQIRLASLSKFNDARLMEVTALRYHTYRSSESSAEDRVTAAMSIPIISFFASDFTTWIHYEPHRQSGGAGLIQDDTWQSWDPNVGMWWTEDEGPGQLYGLLDMKLKYPDALVGGHSVGVLPGHPDQVIAVDGIRFDDMRTNMGATFPDQPIGGWPTVPQPEPDNVAVAAGGDFTCAVKLSGAIRCWGDNFYGQLGDGTHSEHRSGVPVVGIDDAVDVTAGSRHVCALSAGGAVSCWGSNASGQLGAGLADEDSTTPVDVVGLGSGVVEIDADRNVTCAALEDGTARCWGDNARGQLGNGESGAGLFSNVPVVVSGLSTVVEVAAGSCARSAGGAVHCWGPGTDGRIGAGSGADSAVPVPVPLGETATSITTSVRLSCAGTASGVRCWGENPYMGVGSDVPAPVDGMDGPVGAVDAGSNSACLVTGAGGAMCWGVDHDGQLGDSAERESSAVPVPVVGLPTGVDSLAVGRFHACAVAEGFVWCWGDNIYYQSGHTRGSSSGVPVIARA